MKFQGISRFSYLSADFIEGVGKNITGHQFYVNSVIGNSSYSGTTPVKPLATIKQAIAKCTASKGDVIWVMPGHVETISGATSLIANVAGICIIGLGHGTLKPVLTFSATASILSVTSPNVLIENLRLLSDIDNCVTAISAGALADGLRINNVEILDGATNKEFLIDVAIAAACHDVVIDGLRVLGLAGGATAAIVTAGASDNLLIRNCYIQGTFSGAAIDISAAASADIGLHDNFILNRDAGAGLCIKGHATNTGFVCRNFVMGSKNNTETISTGGTLHFAENYGTDTVATSGILTPSTATAWS